MQGYPAAVVAILSVLLAPASALALDKTVKCQAGKHRAIGKYWACREAAVAVALTKGRSVDLARCDQAFERSWGKIEHKASGACPTSGDATAIGDRVSACAVTLGAALEPPTSTTTTLPACGNGVVDAGETCDPPSSCPTCSETQACYTSTGSAATCDLRCHVPVTTCGTGDACCAFDGTGGCGAATDQECGGTGWTSRRWIRDADFAAGCDTIRVYGIHDGGSYAFTTCVPAGTAPGTGDPSITSVVDNAGLAYPVGNDDCSDPTALPRLAGWACENGAGQLRMSCASASPGGFRAVGAGVVRLDVTVCPVNGASGAGTAPFFVWWNASGAPNPG